MADRVMHWEFVVLTFAGLIIPIFAPSKNRRIGRRLFWSGLLLATVAGFFIFFPPDWKAGIGASLLCIIVMSITAYFNSPYLKFRGKILAFSNYDSLPDPQRDSTPSVTDEVRAKLNADSYYGGTTARKFWWLLTFMTGMFAFGVIGYFVDGDNPRVAMVAAAALVAMPSLAGFVDATEGYPLARGQRVQFGLISIITVGAFPLIYFLGYQAGKRWPRSGKHSRQYQAPTRYQKNEP